MKLSDYFAEFLRDEVNLNQSRLDDLNERVGTITAVLKAADNLEGRVLDTIPQGTWAQRTIIRPAFGSQFDADFLVHVFWKPRNFGPEAEQAKDLRGEIIADNGKNVREETTKYMGCHWMACYIVKNGVCVARTCHQVIVS